VFEGCSALQGGGGAVLVERGIAQTATTSSTRRQWGTKYEINQSAVSSTQVWPTQYEHQRVVLTVIGSRFTKCQARMAGGGLALTSSNSSNAEVVVALSVEIQNSYFSEISVISSTDSGPPSLKYEGGAVAIIFATGFRVNGGTVELSGCSFIGNSLQSLNAPGYSVEGLGGGLSIHYSSVVRDVRHSFTSCNFTKNLVQSGFQGFGGGLSLFFDTTITEAILNTTHTFADCEFASNTLTAGSAYGGGASLFYLGAGSGSYITHTLTECMFSNSTIIGTAPSDLPVYSVHCGGLAIVSLIRMYSATDRLTSCRFYANSAANEASGLAWLILLACIQ
jgi:hypothetical protein